MQDFSIDKTQGRLEEERRGWRKGGVGEKRKRRGRRKGEEKEGKVR